MAEQKTKISATERSELRRIVKARYSILREQLTERQKDFQRQIRKQIIAEHQATVAQATKETNRLREKARKLEEEAEALTEKYKALGIVPSHDPQETSRHYRDNLLSVSIISHWAPVEVNQKVHDAWETVASQAGLHAVNLQLDELQLMEDLAVNALDSDAAKQFMAKVPNIDTLLPAPNGNVAQAIEATAREG